MKIIIDYLNYIGYKIIILKNTKKHYDKYSIMDKKIYSYV
jgi:hypothetical protein